MKAQPRAPRGARAVRPVARRSRDRDARNRDRPDVERLRADILWQSRRWRDAGEQYERIVGDAWKGAEPLDDGVRADVMRAAIAYGFGGSALAGAAAGKFSAKMADSEDARAFAVLTSPSGSRADEYRDLAKHRQRRHADRVPDRIPEPLSGRAASSPREDRAPRRTSRRRKPGNASRLRSLQAEKPAGATAVRLSGPRTGLA